MATAASAFKTKQLTAASQTLTAIPTVTETRTVFNQLCTRIIVQKEGPSRPEYEKAFLAYVKARCFSKETDKAAADKQLRATVTLIEKQQPSLKVVSEVAYAVIARFEGPADCIVHSNKGTTVSSEFIEHTKTAFKLQSVASDLIMAREVLALHHRCYSNCLELNQRVDTQNQLFLQRAVIDPHHMVYDFGLSDIIKALEESLEAFSLALKYQVRLGWHNLNQKYDITTKKRRPSSEESIQELLHWQQQPNPHVKQVATALLVMERVSEASRRFNLADQMRNKFLHQVSPPLWKFAKQREDRLKPFAPELMSFANYFGELQVRLRAESNANPNDDAMADADCLGFMSFYEAMEKSGKCTLAYRMFYDLLTEAQHRFQTDNHLKHLHPSQFFKKDGALPTPETFAAFTSETVEQRVKLLAKVVLDQEMLAYEKTEQNRHKRARVKKNQKQRKVLISTAANTSAQAKDDVKHEDGKNKKTDSTPNDKTVPIFATASMPPPSVWKTIAKPAVSAASEPATTFEDIVREGNGEADNWVYDALHVEPWYTNPNQMLVDSGYKKTLEEPMTDWHRYLVLIHTLPDKLNELIGSRYCEESTCMNKHGQESKLYCLVGEMIDPTQPGRPPERGMLSFAVDENTVCWHRCWSKQSTNKLVNDALLGQLLKSADFPTLNEAHKKGSNKANKKNNENGVKIAVTPFGIIEIPLDAAHTLRLTPLS